MAKVAPLAYLISAKDIGADFYEGAPRQIFCEECNSVLDENYMPASLKLYSRTLPDLGYTYDNQAVCSQRFKDFCEEEKYAVDFWKINSVAPAFHFRPRQSLRFDAIRRQTRFLSPCSRCKGYQGVIGAKPVFLLDVTEPIQRGIFRTDLKFGSFASKGSLIIVGIETRAELVKSRFTGG